MPDPTSPQSDDDFMRLAFRLAQQGRGLVEPNPMVGCVLVRKGMVIGQGYHEKFGGPHAEINALRSVAEASRLVGATAYVTLEPCCHTGKTPPCSSALIEAGITRVVAAMRDPFPKVDGGGIGQLQAAGIETVVGLLKTEAEQVNSPYLKRVNRASPWVIAKWAMTADGKIATVGGESQWITGLASRRDVHRLRSRVDAIITGMGTVSADDPTLTARDVDEVARIATRVVMCRKNLPAVDSNLVRTIDQAPLLVAAGPGVDAKMLAQLRQLGADVWQCDDDEPKTMVNSLLAHLCESGATNVMLEGGGAILGSFADARQIDEFQVYLGATIFGGNDALGPIAGTGVQRMRDSARLRLDSVERFGDDVKLTYSKSV